MPGIGLVIEGAVQQAPQAGRQLGAGGWFKEGGITAQVYLRLLSLFVKPQPGLPATGLGVRTVAGACRRAILLCCIDQNRRGAPTESIHVD